MRHTQNTKIRIIYGVLLLFILEMMFRIGDLKLNLPFYGLFFLLMITYYIFDILNFNTVFRTKDFVFSIILNGMFFYVFVLFFKNLRLIPIFFIFTGIQCFFKWFFCKKSENRVTVAVIGDRESNGRIERIIQENHRFKFAGFYKVEEIDEKKFYQEIDKVVYTQELDEKETKKALRLRLSGLKVLTSQDFLEIAEGKVDMENIDRKWLLKTSGFKLLNNTLEQRIKRLFDLLAGTVVFIGALPFIGITYIIVKLDNPKNFFKNPAFFKQKRIGYGGKEFEIIKFRSMKIHDPNEHSKYASKNDNRITKVGKFIRKTRLDELPQLWNVFRGDMSFVGPRPEWNELGRDYEEKIPLYKIRYAVKPGLTGWAQVMYPYGANLDDTKRKLEYDVYYIKHQTFVLDMIIFFKTVKTVVFGKGM